MDALHEIFPMLKNKSKNSPSVRWSVDWGLRLKPVIRIWDVVRDVSSLCWSLFFRLCLAGLPLVSIWCPFHLGCNRTLYQFLFHLNIMIRYAHIREKKKSIQEVYKLLTPKGCYRFGLFILVHGVQSNQSSSVACTFSLCCYFLFKFFHLKVQIIR